MDRQTAARQTLDNLTNHERTLLADLDKLRYLANEADGPHAYQARTYGAIETALIETLKTAIEIHTRHLDPEALDFAKDLVGEMTRSYVSAVEILEYAANTEVV